MELRERLVVLQQFIKKKDEDEEKTAAKEKKKSRRSLFVFLSFSSFFPSPIRLALTSQKYITVYFP
jgi:hypothetical protein